MKRLLFGFHNLNIRKKLIFSFAVLVVIPILLSMAFSYGIMTDTILEKINNANISSLEAISKNLDRIIYDITGTLLNLSNNDELRNVLVTDAQMNGKGGYNDTNRHLFIENFNTISKIFQNIALNIFLYDAKLTLLNVNGPDYGNWTGSNLFTSYMKEEKWYDEMTKNKFENILWIGMNKNREIYGKENDYMLEATIAVKENISRTDTIISGTNVIGVVHLGFPEKIIYEALKSENSQGDIFIVDSSGIIMSTQDKDDILKPFVNIIDIDLNKITSQKWVITENSHNSKIIVNSIKISKLGWRIVSIVPYDSMMAPLTSMKKLLFLINTLFILCFMAVALFISKNISKPIVQLTQRMKLVEKGKFDEIVDARYNDEIGNLGRSFNHMLEKVNELLNTVKQQEKLKREAELDALQAQINPHFLFNTLSSIRWMAAASGNTKVEDMVYALSNLLKMSINKGPDNITIEEEIIFLKYYIELFEMKQRYSYKLICDLPEEILSCRIPKLIMQPIVENSIIHGFENMISTGVVMITGEIKDNILRIEISDNGKGVDDDLLDNILKGKIKMISKSRQFISIGIKNVDERIKLNYGEQYGLMIKSRQCGGTTATLVLPYQGSGELSAESDACR